MDCREFNQNLWTMQVNIYCICFSRLEWVALTLMSLILYFKFPQPINSGCSQSASMDMSRDGLLMSFWNNLGLAKLMRLLISTAEFQRYLRQGRSGGICSKSRH